MSLVVWDLLLPLLLKVDITGQISLFKSNRQTTICMKSPVLIVPGWTNSGPEHWQSIWQRANPAWQRVEQAEWNFPQVEDWLANLDRQIATCQAPPILVGHSLGCIAITRWSVISRAPVAGAFLVAPADVEAEDTPVELRGFAPIPLTALRFPSYMVVSENDEFLSLPRANQLAKCWRSTLKNIGPSGHIGTAAGYGAWPEGKALLDAFIGSINLLKPNSSLHDVMR
jgi:predicted alpha/beta hydrolase family esterase